MPQISTSQVSGIKHSNALVPKRPLRQDPFDISDHAVSKALILACESSAQFGFQQTGRDEMDDFVQSSRFIRRAWFIEGNGR